MIRALVFLFLLLALPRFGHAQTITPEFELKLHYSDAGGGGNSDPKGFGYDPAATDTIDPQFGENYYPFFQTGLGSYELAFATFDSAGDYTEIDILPKPTTDSFVLQYTLYLSPYQVPAKLSWDRTQIPAAIKGIWITPLGAPFLKMGDMVTQDSVVITRTVTDTNYYGNWAPAVLTLYYNTTPAFLDVSPSLVSTSGLLSSLATYPNPMLTSGTLSFYLSDAASIIVSGYDALGREVLRVAKNEPAGENTIDLSSAVSAHSGAILLRVDAANDMRQETKSVMMVKE
jgi:hypothetical protein